MNNKTKKLFLSSEEEKRLIQESQNEEEEIDFISSLKIIQKQNKIEKFETQDLNKIKQQLKARIYSKGYNSIENYANNTKIKYSPNTIRRSFSLNYKTSDKILKEIAKDLGVTLKIKKKVEKIFLLEI